MDRYKPGYMGKIIPADDPIKLTDFVENKYNAFSKFYDACKEVSDKISEIKMVDNPTSTSTSDTLSVKITTDTHTIASIQESCKADPTITVSDYVITAKG